MKRYLLLMLMIIIFEGLIAQNATTVSLSAVDSTRGVIISDCDEEEEAFIDYSPAFENKREEPLRIYPNPTTEYISVTDNSQVAYLYVYNIIGRRVKSFPVFGGGQYSLRDLPDGMYLIGMVDATGRILKTVRTSKSVPRP